MADTIREYVELNMPETYRMFQARYDGKEKFPDVVGGRVARVMERLFVDDTDESDLTNWVRGYLGDVVSIEIVPPAIDHATTEMRARSSSAPPGRVEMGGESSDMYDRIKSLKDMREQWAARVLADAGRFVDEASAFLRNRAGGTAAMTSSTIGQPLRTADPYDFDRYAGERYVTRFGVPVIVVYE